MNRFIIIEGNIGTGKTSLSKKLAHDLGYKLILEEFEDNSFLPKFYEDQRRYAFPLELSFLASRFNQLKKQLIQTDLFAGGVLSDYAILKCLVFSRTNLDDDEYVLYQKLFEIIQPQLPKPNLLIYLHKSVSKLQENIHKRGRVYEQQIKDQYLKQLEIGYFDYFKMKPDFPIVIVDSESLNFVENESDYAGSKVSAGTYFVRIQSGTDLFNEKIIVIPGE